MTLDLFPKRKLTDLLFLDNIAGLFKAYGLVQAYQQMIYFADRGLRVHPETARVPALRDLLIDYFIENYEKHIDVPSGGILRIGEIGTAHSVRDWQQAGYATRRTKSNYARRMRYWRAIYDETDLIVERKNTTPAPRGLSFSSRRKPKQTPDRYANLGRVKDAEGNVVTYEYVITRRNAQYSATRSTIPFWFVLNYGTRGGYPEVKGIYFVERAEREIDRHLNRALDLFDRFALDVLIKDVEASYSVAATWLRRYARSPHEYFNSVEAARTLALRSAF